MNAKATVVFFALLAVALATPVQKATPFTDCGSVSTLNSVTISGCDSTPCVFQRGSEVTVTVEWASHAAVEDFHAEVLVVLDGELIQVPGLCDAKLPGECSGCSDLTTGDCPLETTEVATYTRTVPIDASWPEVATPVDAIFKIDSEPPDEVLVCFTVPVVIV